MPLFPLAAVETLKFFFVCWPSAAQGSFSSACSYCHIPAAARPADMIVSDYFYHGEIVKYILGPSFDLVISLHFLC